MPRRSETGRHVYIAGLGHHDYESARDYGDLVVVISGNVDLDDTEDLQQRIATAMSAVEPDDYVLLSGAPIICILCANFVQARYGFVNVLQWNGVDRCYIAHKLEMENALK